MRYVHLSGGSVPDVLRKFGLARPAVPSRSRGGLGIPMTAPV
jgi:hypothetical protein